MLKRIYNQITPPYFIMVIMGLLLDQSTKVLAQKYLQFFSETVIIKPLLSFQLVYNFGAAYGILQHKKALLLVISCFVIFILIFFKKHLSVNKFSRLATACLWVGTLGNLIDRIRLGYVVDFINIHIIPVFNVADIAINLAVLFFILDAIFEHRHAR